MCTYMFIFHFIPEALNNQPTWAEFRYTRSIHNREAISIELSGLALVASIPRSFERIREKAVSKVSFWG